MADVLLVDDDGSVLLTLTLALRRQGHNVTAACDARQALAHLSNHRFAFLISDVRMPGMSGLELARQAHHIENPPRIILTSAYSNVETQEDIVEAFLPKPIDIARLNALLSDNKNKSSGAAEKNNPSPESRSSGDAPMLRVAMSA